MDKGAVRKQRTKKERGGGRERERERKREKERGRKRERAKAIEKGYEREPQERESVCVCVCGAYIQSMSSTARQSSGRTPYSVWSGTAGMSARKAAGRTERRTRSSSRLTFKRSHCVSKDAALCVCMCVCVCVCVYERERKIESVGLCGQFVSVAQSLRLKERPHRRQMQPLRLRKEPQASREQHARKKHHCGHSSAASSGRR